MVGFGPCLREYLRRVQGICYTVLGSFLLKVIIRVYLFIVLSQEDGKWIVYQEGRLLITYYSIFKLGSLIYVNKNTHHFPEAAFGDS